MSQIPALREKGYPWCDEHDCELTWTPFGWKCEDCCREARTALQEPEEEK